MLELTAAQARAIKTADALCFDGDSDGNGFIRAISRGADHNHERTTNIRVESNRVSNYGVGVGPWVCFDMISSAQYDEHARTITRRMKAGTRIGLIWTRNNSSPVTYEAGVVVDMLDIQVQNGNVCDTFRVRTFVGLDNSARMVRRA